MQGLPRCFARPQARTRYYLAPFRRPQLLNKCKLSFFGRQNGSKAMARGPWALERRGDHRALVTAGLEIVGRLAQGFQSSSLLLGGGAV